MIKRIHAALVQRGYSMWIDVEQMKGSTVDAMSLAVEDAEVVLIGVSRAYKESTNCRLEAQYAMQREVETVPLMLVDGYQADGWLGMLIGTRMWYGFYGAALRSQLRLRARLRSCVGSLAIVVVRAWLSAPSPSPTPRSQERSVLEGMRLSELKQRAIAADRGDRRRCGRRRRPERCADRNAAGAAGASGSGRGRAAARAGAPEAVRAEAARRRAGPRASWSVAWMMRTTPNRPPLPLCWTAEWSQSQSWTMRVLRVLLPRLWRLTLSTCNPRTAIFNHHV